MILQWRYPWQSLLFCQNVQDFKFGCQLQVEVRTKNVTVVYVFCSEVHFSHLKSAFLLIWSDKMGRTALSADLSTYRSFCIYSWKLIDGSNLDWGCWPRLLLTIKIIPDSITRYGFSSLTVQFSKITQNTECIRKNWVGPTRTQNLKLIDPKHIIHKDHSSDRILWYQEETLHFRHWHA